MRLLSFKIISAILLFVFFLANCKKETKEDVVPEDVQPPTTPLTPFTLKYPSYFPNLTIPADNPLTLEGINLGRRLYYDTILSNNGSSCSSCHDSKQSFTTYASNALAHVNLGWNSYYLWNGEYNGRLENVMQFEVDVFFQTDISKLNNSTFYKKEFKKIYHVETISSTNVAYALSQFFRAMVSSNSVADKFFQKTGGLTNSQMNGFVIFNTERGDCFHCHSIGLFTDDQFHNIGIDSVFTGVNSGRYNVTGNHHDIGLFKTPTLRNIELTAPYMHDGRFKTLEEVVEHYNSRVKQSATLDPIMTKGKKMLYGLGLTKTEKQDLVAFLKTLTDTTFTNNPLLQKP